MWLHTALLGVAALVAFGLLVALMMSNWRDGERKRRHPDDTAEQTPETSAPLQWSSLPPPSCPDPPALSAAGGSKTGRARAPANPGHGWLPAPNATEPAAHATPGHPERAPPPAAGISNSYFPRPFSAESRFDDESTPAPRAARGSETGRARAPANPGHGWLPAPNATEPAAHATPGHPERAPPPAAGISNSYFPRPFSAESRFDDESTPAPRAARGSETGRARAPANPGHGWLPAPNTTEPAAHATPGDPERPPPPAAGVTGTEFPRSKNNITGELNPVRCCYKWGPCLCDLPASGHDRARQERAHHTHIASQCRGAPMCLTASKAAGRPGTVLADNGT